MIMFKLYILFSCMSFMNSKTEIHSFTVTLCCKSWFDQYTLSRVTMLPLCASLLAHPMKPSCSIEQGGVTQPHSEGNITGPIATALPKLQPPSYQNQQNNNNNHQNHNYYQITTTTTIILYVVCRYCYVLKQIYKFELS